VEDAANGPCGLRLCMEVKIFPRSPQCRLLTRQHGRWESPYSARDRERVAQSGTPIQLDRKTTIVDLALERPRRKRRDEDGNAPAQDGFVELARAWLKGSRS